MGDQSKIEWTEATWNPWHGCAKVSPGCKECYMFREKRAYGQDPTVVVRSKTTFNDPLKWEEPKLVFTCSWSDWFINVADEWRAEAWSIIRRTPHIYQILTKRVERVADHLPTDWGDGYPNVWLGVSVENQEYADRRIHTLLQIPARVKFISAEPLLGPIDLARIKCTGVGYMNGLDGRYDDCDSACDGLDWVIAGGESGPGARPTHPDWVRSVRDQCVEKRVPFFFKQWGEWLPLNQQERGHCPEGRQEHIWPDGRIYDGTEVIKKECAQVSRVGKKAAGRLLDGREWNEVPLNAYSRS